MLIPGRKSRGEFCSELKEHSELCDWNEELKAPVIFEWNGNFCINIIFWINGFLKLPPPWRLFCWIAKIHQSRSSLRSFFIYSNLAKRYATGNLTFIIKHPLNVILYVIVSGNDKTPGDAPLIVVRRPVFHDNGCGCRNGIIPLRQ